MMLNFYESQHFYINSSHYTMTKNEQWYIGLKPIYHCRILSKDYGYINPHHDIFMEGITSQPLYSCGLFCCFEV